MNSEIHNTKCGIYPLVDYTCIHVHVHNSGEHTDIIHAHTHKHHCCTKASIYLGVCDNALNNIIHSGRTLVICLLNIWYYAMVLRELDDFLLRCVQSSHDISLLKLGIVYFLPSLKPQG